MLTNATKLPDSPANLNTKKFFPVAFLLAIQKRFFFPPTCSYLLFTTNFLWLK